MPSLKSAANSLAHAAATCITRNGIAVRNERADLRCRGTNGLRSLIECTGGFGFNVSVGDRKQANAAIQFRTKPIPNHHEISGYQADLGQHYWGAPL